MKQKLANKSKLLEKYCEAATDKIEKKVGKKYAEANKDAFFVKSHRGFIFLMEYRKQDPRRWITKNCCKSWRKVLL